MRNFIILMLLINPLSADGLKTQLNRDLQGVMTKVTDWRHYFHQYPELSNREYKTQESIAEALIEMGLEPNTDFGITGVTAFIRGQNPGPLIALRADIDGLQLLKSLICHFHQKLKLPIKVMKLESCMHVVMMLI